MKIVKRIFLILGIIIFLVLGTALVLPIIFKDDLMRLAKQEINKSLNATVEFEDVSLSLLRDFPDLSFAIENYSVTGTGQFEGVRLASGESVALTLDLLSVLSNSRPSQLKSVTLERPDIQVFILKDGTANYDIVKSDVETVDTTTTEEAADFEVQLKDYRIIGGNLLYDDRSTDTYVQVRELDHRGSGNFTRDIFDLVTETTIPTLTIRQGGIDYLDNATVALDATFNIDQPNSKYTLKENRLTINAFAIQGDGSVQLMDDSYLLDLRLDAPENEFKNLLSLIPNAYTQGFEEVQANGQFQFDADIQGTYRSDPGQYPSFRVNLEVDNGNFQYPDLPMGISSISTKASINSPTSDLNDMVIDVPSFRVLIGDNPFTARFHLETPISDPDIDAAAKGTINLRDLQQAYPMEGIEALAGVIVADLEAQTRLSYIEQKAYERVRMDGNLTLENFRYESADYPPIEITQSQMTFTPRQVQINSFEAKLGSSDLQATGSIDNILAYISPEKTMTGKLSLSSGYFNADEWYPEEETSEEAATQPIDTSGDYEVFDRFNFAVNAQAEEIIYLGYQLKNTTARGQVTANHIDISEASTLIEDSDFHGNGTITGVFDYLYENGVLGGQLQVDSRFINLNQFMEEEEGAPADTSAGDYNYLEAIQVPPRIDLGIDANVERLQYTNISLQNVTGTILIEEESVSMENVTGRLLGGTINLQGGYNTIDPQKPAFSMKLDLSSLNFQNAFNTLNTFQALAPIGKFINGRFNSSLILDGTLTESLMPDLRTLDAQGYLETLDAVVQNFKPLQSVGQKLNVEFLTEQWKLDNLKSWFEVQDGVVEVKPFDTKIRDIAMTISGRHGLNMEMDYDLQAAIPRELLRKSGIGQAADAGLSFLQKQASQLGINFQQGDYINVLINLTGSIQQPDVGLKLLGTGGEQSLAEQAERSLREEVDEQIQRGKETVEQKGQELLDTAKTAVEEQVDKVRQQAEETARKQADEAAKSIEEKAKETVGEIIDSSAVKKTSEDIKKELERWNPFKKKPATPKVDTTKKDTTKTGGN